MFSFHFDFDDLLFVILMKINRHEKHN